MWRARMCVGGGGWGHRYFDLWVATGTEEEEEGGDGIGSEEDAEAKHATLRAIEAWREAWEQAGWTVRVLNSFSAEKHPQFGYLMETFEKQQAERKPTT